MREINSRKVSCNLTWDSPPPAFLRVTRGQQEWTCLPLESSHCQPKKNSNITEWSKGEKSLSGKFFNVQIQSSTAFKLVWDLLLSACCMHVCSSMFMYLQASLVSLPLSVLPDWLQLLEPLSGLLSCCWCSGSRSKALRRQIAANSILATGIAADWPSLHTNTNG